jgi:hypothetical protein
VDSQGCTDRRAFLLERSRVSRQREDPMASLVAYGRSGSEWRNRAVTTTHGGNFLNSSRTAVLAAAALTAGLAGTASAATGGNPASAVPPGCSYARGVTTCTTSSTTGGTPSVVTTPGTFQSTTGPAYDLEAATNAAGNCTPGAPSLAGSSVTTTPAGTTTTTTAHRGAPGSSGEALPTSVSSVPGQPTVATVPQPASPGTVTVTGFTASAVFTGLKPTASYAIGVRCDPAGAAFFVTDSSGNGSAVLDLSSHEGQTIQIEMFLGPQDYFGPDYAVTAPLTVGTAPRFVTATSTNGNPVAVVTMSKPVVCSSLTGSDFILRWNYDSTGSYDVTPAVSCGSNSTTSSTITVSYTLPGNWYNNTQGTFQILASGTDNLVDQQGMKQPSTDSVAVVVS